MRNKITKLSVWSTGGKGYQINIWRTGDILSLLYYADDHRTRRILNLAQNKAKRTITTLERDGLAIHYQF